MSMMNKPLVDCLNRGITQFIPELPLVVQEILEDILLYLVMYPSSGCAFEARFVFLRTYVPELFCELRLDHQTTVIGYRLDEQLNERGLSIPWNLRVIVPVLYDHMDPID